MAVAALAAEEEEDDDDVVAGGVADDGENVEKVTLVAEEEELELPTRTPWVGRRVGEQLPPLFPAMRAERRP